MDLASPLNDRALHPASAYTHVERLLARLEALTLVPPACQAQHAAMYRRARTRLVLSARSGRAAGWCCTAVRLLPQYKRSL